MPTPIRKTLRTMPDPAFKATEPVAVAPHKRASVKPSRAGHRFPPDELRRLAAMLLAPEKYDVAAEAAQLERLAAKLEAAPRANNRGPRKLYTVDDGHEQVLLPLGDAAAKCGITDESLRVGLARGGGHYRKLRRDGQGNPVMLRVSVGFPSRSDQSGGPE